MIQMITRKPYNNYRTTITRTNELQHCKSSIPCHDSLSQIESVAQLAALRTSAHMNKTRQWISDSFAALQTVKRFQVKCSKSASPQSNLTNVYRISHSDGHLNCHRICMLHRHLATPGRRYKEILCR